MKIFLKAWVFSGLLIQAQFAMTSANAAGKAEHVVIVVWDGMRPDFITPQYAPTLYSLATNGVFFKNHHPAYISSTEVNGTALATGMHPGRSGIIANTDYRPEIDWTGTFATEGLNFVRQGDLLTDGNYLLVPTLAEIVQKAGHPTVTAGTKPVVLLHDRSHRRTTSAASNSVNFFKGQTIPRSALPPLVKLNDDKAFPTNTTHPNTAADAWTTKAFARGLWKNGVPKYSLLWLSEPDASQHETGVGSDTALSAIESSDKNLAEVLKVLDEKKVREKTDVFVVSDHGFSTIVKGPDVADILKKAKFTGGKKFENPEPGDVMVIGLGGSVSFYVLDRVEAVVRRLVEFLQMSDFAGVIFSRLPIEGTFPLEQARIGTTNNAPDVVISMRWNEDKNEHGAAGLMWSSDGKKNRGSHASLSRFDMHNTLVASGPDFKKGFISETPSGNIDVAPTVLWILGMKPELPMDGRVLHEALATSKQPVPSPETKLIEATRDLGMFRWRQYLKFTQVGTTVYFDEGNGAPMLNSGASSEERAVAGGR